MFIYVIEHVFCFYVVRGRKNIIFVIEIIATIKSTNCFRSTTQFNYGFKN